MASIRKIYIDSRFGIGPPNDFTVELPLQVTTTKEQGLVLGQFSIPNVFGSVIAGYNDRLYWRVDGVNAPNTIQAGVNDRFYWGWDDGQQNWVITTLPAGTYTAAQMATLLSVRINTVIPDLTQVWGPPQYDAPVIRWQSTTHALYLPSYQDITDPTWQRSVWRGAAYNVLDSRSVGCILNETPQWQREWTVVIQEPSAFIDYNVCNTIAPGTYTGADFATQLQSTLSFGAATTGNTPTCTYIPDEGVVRIQGSKAIMIFDPSLLDSPRWLADEWFAPKYNRLGQTLNPGDLRSANHIAWGPQAFSTDFLTYHLDLSGIREVYVHCSVSDNMTLSISGMRDVIGCVQIDESWGSVITYRPFSLADQDIIPLQDGVLGPTMRFYLTDAYGKPLPIGQSYVFIQLSIVPLNTMET